MTASTPSSSLPADVRAYLEQHPAPEVVDACIVDCNGILRGKRVPGEALERLYTKGLCLPASSLLLDIWGSEVEETDLVAATGDADHNCFPVPGSLRPMPWSRRPAAQLLMRMETPDGEPWSGDPRNQISQLAARLAEHGYRPVVASEIEFRLFRAEAGPDGHPQLPPRPAACGHPQLYGFDDLELRADLFAEIEAACAAQGLPADALIAEQSESQFELNLRHVDDPVLAADQAILFKRTLRAVAQKHGLMASFMAKPFGDESGNGQHVHVSLVDADGNNAFTEEGCPSRLLHQAVAGLIDSMRDATALFAPHANSFRRFQPNSHMPLQADWGFDNRMAALRVPLATPAATRIEHRVAGADANPYLVIAAILAGMEHGIRNKMEPPSETHGDRVPAGTPWLPHSWELATNAFRDSDFIAEYFGTDYRRMYTAVKEHEQAAMRRHVPRAEYDTYLGSI